MTVFAEMTRLALLGVAFLTGGNVFQCAVEGGDRLLSSIRAEIDILDTLPERATAAWLPPVNAASRNPGAAPVRFNTSHPNVHDTLQ